jgi:hydroxymethylpyrimidine/phosphomethylpyrimidine kinase
MQHHHSGLEADQKVIAAHGCYAMTATTALTAQNTKGVYGIHLVPPEFLRKQIDAVVEDVGVDVVKTGKSFYPVSYRTLKTYQHGMYTHPGMLASTETIAAVADALEHHNLSRIVVDPVNLPLSPTLPHLSA